MRMAVAWGTAWAVLVVGTAMGGEPSSELLALGKRVEQRVVELRGLTVRTPIRWETASRKEVRAYLLDTLARQYREDELANEGAALEALGLIPASLDYRSFILELVTEQIGGYYDPHQDTFYLAAWLDPSMQETVIAHELTHALQDQHFGIEAFVERIRGNSDAQLARAALVEGDATLVMLVDAMRQAGREVDLSTLDPDGPLWRMLMSFSASEMPRFSGAPRALQEMLMFPYLHGLEFVARGRKLGGWERIDRAYRDLPASTEQILHPARYYMHRDPPTPLALGFLDGLVPPAWEPIHQDVLGELLCRMLLVSLGDEDEAVRAAAGWDGDRVRVFRKAKRLAWVQLSVWDSGRDAVEYAAAFARTVPHRTGRYTLQPLDDDTRMYWKDGEDGLLQVVRRGTRVLVSEGFDAANSERIRKAAFR